MKKLILLSFIIAIVSQVICGQSSEKMMIFNYEKPYQYKLVNGSYKVKAFANRENWSDDVELSFNNETISVEKLENGNVQIWLPLIGNPGLLKITKFEKKKKVIQKQHFVPLIPADWGYFAEGQVHLIVSSHQDIGWMNTPDTCREERVHKIVLPALDLMEQQNTFKFEMEQSLNLMETLEDSPENKQRLIDTYKSGNFEWGATFTQPYEGLESGEQLVRQAYLGRRWIKNSLLGMDARVAYNVDVPGRSLQVPQLFKKSGIDYLFVSR